jgi:uncharacterized protein (TIGR02284 family)
MANHKYVVDALEDLIQVARDGQSGYRDGAEHAKDRQLRRFLESVSLARAKFAGDLEGYAVRLGNGDVDRSGSVKGAIQRGWTDLKANLGGDDSILSSMETGDSYAKHRYEKYAHDNKLPDDILETIRIQQQTIAATLDRVRAMRQTRKAA